MNKTGALSGLERVGDEIEAPGPGEARVKVRAIGLNFADVFSVLGMGRSLGGGKRCCVSDYFLKTYFFSSPFFYLLFWKTKRLPRSSPPPHTQIHSHARVG